MLSANARREEIYHLAVAIGLASVKELSARFEVMASTIRCDLALLNSQGQLAPTAGRWRWEASVIQHWENFLLDAGFTAGALAHELCGFGPCP